MNFDKIELNAGTGMVMGVLIASLVALIVSATTGDNFVWTYAIPIGIAMGVAIGAGAQKNRKETEITDSE